MPQRPRLLGAASPAPDPDHQVECLPTGERIIGAMYNDEPAPFLHKLLQLRPQVGRPVWSIVIQDDCLIAAEIRLEVAEVLTKARRCCGGDAEYPGGLKIAFQHA